MAVTYPPKQAGELATLTAFLDYYRDLLLRKASGITDEQLHTRLEPSTLTLGAIINHMAVVEHWWFHECFAGADPLEPWASAPWDDDSDWEINTAHEVPTTELFARYTSAVVRSREVLAGVDSLDALSAKDRNGEKWSMRWILVHMIEEIARHAGHADFIREAIDGATGDHLPDDE